MLSNSIPLAKVDDVFNPSGDGHCGFRCLAHELKNSNQDKYDVIKSEMLEYLISHHKQYNDNNIIFGSELDRLYQILRHRGPCGPAFWFSSPDCAQLAADAFKIPIEIHSSNGSILFLPLTRHRYESYKPIILQLHCGHFYLVKLMRCRRQFPKVYPLYSGAVNF